MKPFEAYDELPHNAWAMTLDVETLSAAISVLVCPDRVVRYCSNQWWSFGDPSHSLNPPTGKHVTGPCWIDADGNVGDELPDYTENFNYYSLLRYALMSGFEYMTARGADGPDDKQSWYEAAVGKLGRGYRVHTSGNHNPFDYETQHERILLLRCLVEFNKPLILTQGFDGKENGLSIAFAGDVSAGIASLKNPLVHPVECVRKSVEG